MGFRNRSFQENLFRIKTYSGRWFGTRPVKADAPIVICCVFKNEAPYLVEWIQFHIKAGVSRFYLINNHSDDNYREVLKPYIKDGIVHLINTKTKHISVFIQSWELTRGLDIIRKKEGVDCWMAVLDMDEFLYSVVNKSIIQILNEYEGQKVASVLTNWLMFGTGGVKHLDETKPMIEQLTRRAPDDCQDHLLFKPLAYVANVYRFTEGPHLPYKKDGTENYYCDGTPYDPAKWTFRKSPMRINHYWYRSEEYYFNKKIAKKNAFGVERNKKKIEDYHMNLCNQVEDRTILEID
mgnify:CR=1 FL=1